MSEDLRGGGGGLVHFHSDQSQECGAGEDDGKERPGRREDTRRLWGPTGQVLTAARVRTNCGYRGGVPWEDPGGGSQPPGPTT